MNNCAQGQEGRAQEVSFYGVWKEKWCFFRKTHGERILDQENNVQK